MNNVVSLYTSAWIEISRRWLHRRRIRVALYTSAWIEMTDSGHQVSATASRTLHECVDWNSLTLIAATVSPKSHSTRVRGLKLKERYATSEAGSRTLHECVDWNHNLALTGWKYHVALYTSAWIEIFVPDNVPTTAICRTLHECVDWNNSRISNVMCQFRRTLHECVDWNTIYNNSTFAVIKSV